MSGPADFLASVAYQEGRRAGKAGLAAGLNPHPSASVEFDQWRQGYHRGLEERNDEQSRRAA